MLIRANAITLIAGMCLQLLASPRRYNLKPKGAEMHKLVILVEPLPDENSFDDAWPAFLNLAERMPGLKRETTSRVASVLYGKYPCSLLHELYFDSLADIQAAMATPEGRAAGEMLQKMTAGRLTLIVADHKEDELANIRKFRSEETEHE